MRLLHVRDFAFKYFGAEPPQYAILSHRWDEEETKISDIQSGRVNAATTTHKVSNFAQYVRNHLSSLGEQSLIEWIWVDSCCINQDSAAELSEGVNCMFDWYRNANICIAYLRDVDKPSNEVAFRNSVWFKRGWTLQELLAPSVVVFVTSDWKVIGHKGDATHLRHKTEVGRNLEAILAEVTKVPRGILQNFSLSHELSLEERFLWMDGRDTLKEEDQFYALFGIFGVAPGANYGETKRRARQRLLDAIDKEQGSLHHVSEEQSERIHMLRQWLSPPDPSSNHDTACDRREPGTCEWLLRNKTYKAWKSGQTHHLWINGKPGCGKSVLCSAVIQDLEVHLLDKANACLAYFYFTFSDDSKQNYSDLMLSLVSQLAWKESAQASLKQLHTKPGQAKPTMLELEKILKSTIATFDEVYVVLDALDESPEAGNQRKELLRRLQSLASASPKLKLCATSRNLPGIADLMEDLPCGQIKIGPKDVIDDIQRYVSAQLDTDLRLKKFKPQVKARVKENISERVDGMFRWAYLLLEKLSSLKAARPSDIEATLVSFPADLDDVYARILKDLEDADQKDARILLKWITYAARPLNLDELVDALVIDPEQDKVDFENRHPEPQDILRCLTSLVVTYESTSYRETDLLEWFGGSYNSGPNNDHNIDHDTDHASDAVKILRSRSTKVRLAHFTVQEYLESTRIFKGEAEQFQLERKAAHLYIEQCCLTYLVHYSKSAEKQSSKFDLLTFPLLLHAAEQWFEYAMMSPEDTDVSFEMRLLQDDTAKHDWLEVHKPDRHYADSFITPEGYSFAPSVYYTSYLGLTKATRTLLEGGSDVNAFGWIGSTLRAASANDHTETVKLLLENGAKDERVLLAAAGAYHVEIVRLLLTHGDDSQKDKAISEAVDKGRLDIVKLLLEHGAEASSRAVRSAAQKGYLDVVKLLFEHGAEVSSYAVHEEAWYGNFDIVKLLLEHGAEASSYAMNDAAREGYLEIVKLLLEYGAEASSYAVNKAVEYGHFDNVKLLLEHGAEPSSDAMIIAAQYGHLDIVMLLLEHGAEASSDAVSRAAAYGHHDIVKLLLEHGAEASSDALGMAALHGHIDSVKLLLEHRVQVSADAIGYAAARGELIIVRLMLEAASIGVLETADARQLLYQAGKGGNDDIIKLLLEAGADVCGAGRYAVLCGAAVGGHLETVMQLLEQGVDINTVMDGYDAVKSAVRSENVDILKLLLRHGADIEPAVRNGVLRAAICDDTCDIMALLLDSGANVKTEEGHEALRAAAEEGKSDMVSLLLERGADATAITSGSLYPWFRYTARGNEETPANITRMLVAHGGPDTPYRSN